MNLFLAFIALVGSDFFILVGKQSIFQVVHPHIAPHGEYCLGISAHLLMLLGDMVYLTIGIYIDICQIYVFRRHDSVDLRNMPCPELGTKVRP